MEVVRILVLICSTSLSGGECQVYNARVWLDAGPAREASMCGFNAQRFLTDPRTRLAHPDLDLTVRPGEFVKAQCFRATSIGKGSVG
jgi:hypothetical protein